MSAIIFPTINKRLVASLFATGSIIGGSYVYYNNKLQSPTPTPSKKVLFSGIPLYKPSRDNTHSIEDYQKIYNSIADKILEYDEYDDYIGFGPILVRLAWHSSGTFTDNDSFVSDEHKGCPVAVHLTNKDGSKGVGGSFGGTIRFPKEAGDGGNNGLENARWLLDQVYKEFPWISHGDLYTLGGVVAIQEAGGPKIGWRKGREDLNEDYQQTNRLPDASQDANYVRQYFARIGIYDDREAVSLLGAHALGACHVIAPLIPGASKSTGPGSGYTGRWTASPNYFTNDFYKLLLNDKWELKKWDGPRQYENKDSLMMLPTDYALVEDAKYKKIVQEYANDQDKFFKDFAKDFQKLLELGINFGKQESWYFKTLDEQA